MMLAPSRILPRIMAPSRIMARQTLPLAAHPFSTIPVNAVASVLHLNVRDEATAIKFDEAMKTMTEMMRAHEGFQSATRQVCKTEWAYELSFVFSPEGFGTWKESTTRDAVHAFYLDALQDCSIKEDDVYGGARVTDKW